MDVGLHLHGLTHIPCVDPTGVLTVHCTRGQKFGAFGSITHVRHAVGVLSQPGPAAAAGRGAGRNANEMRRNAVATVPETNETRFMHQCYKTVRNAQWQSSPFVDIEDVVLKGIFELHAAAAGFMRKLRKLGDERRAPSLLAGIGTGFQEHIFGSPKENAMNRLRRLTPRERTLVVYP